MSYAVPETLLRDYARAYLFAAWSCHQSPCPAPWAEEVLARAVEWLGYWPELWPQDFVARIGGREVDLQQLAPSIALTEEELFECELWAVSNTPWPES